MLIFFLGDTPDKNNESDPDWKESNQENSSSDWLVGLKFEKHDAGNGKATPNVVTNFQSFSLLVV